jgi:hypothetical protein
MSMMCLEFKEEADRYLGRSFGLERMADGNGLPELTLVGSLYY